MRGPPSVRAFGYAPRMGKKNSHVKELVHANLLVAMGVNDEARTTPPLTHEEIARLAGVGKGTVGRIYRGEVAPRVDTLEAIAGVFGVRAWQMLVGPLNMQSKPELLTKELKDELKKLRALRVLAEEFARGSGTSNPTGMGDNNAVDSQSVRRKPAGGTKA